MTTMKVSGVEKDFAEANFDAVDVESIKKRLRNYLIHNVGVDPVQASHRDWMYAVVGIVRGILSKQYIDTAERERVADVRRVYYLSLEYLTGRSLIKVLLDLDLYALFDQALQDVGQDLRDVQEYEFDAALGNGGLGRLAACFFDSIATHSYPGFGYGIRYEFGMFTQRIENGEQVEHPETWLRYGNPWEFERSTIIYPVRFRGKIVSFKNERGEPQSQWVDTEDVIAMAYDVPISGHRSGVVTKLRLWSARATRDFDLRYFNQGNYIDAVKDKTISENLSKVLYPADTTLMGQELRLMQEYFFVSASVQDILARFLREHDNLASLSKKVCIQLNDTHPSLAILELTRLLLDQYGYEWNEAWATTREIFNYTNHTLLPEALETWPIAMLEVILPRHLEILYRINAQFLHEVKLDFPGQPDLLSRMSLIDDAARRVRMAHLAVVGSAQVNGVAALHSSLMRSHVFADFHRMWPEKIVNVTNGVTQRRWLLQANPELAALITEGIGEGWRTDLERIREIEAFSGDASFCERFADIKRKNKERLAALVEARCGIRFSPEALFDTQIKRIHEYKRQLLNLLHVVALYARIRDGRTDVLPRAVLIAGKAAPGYLHAKLIVRLINDVAMQINNDPKVKGQLALVFLPNYNVSSAEIAIPGTNLSEQISTAGMEASGTGNMKFALNGALTIGTLDGANIEIKDAVGEENIFIFGRTAAEVAEMRAQGYRPWDFYHGVPELKRVIDMIADGFFNADDPDRYKPIANALLVHGDHYFLLADFASYLETQQLVADLYLDQKAWTRKAIVNVARVGRFSSDRSIHDYARTIWKLDPIP